MRIVWTISLLLAISPLFAQKNGDAQIVIKLSDTSTIYQKVKYALVNTDFMLKDNGRRDTLTTYAREYSGMFCVAQAVIIGDIVILSGAYGLKRIDDWGYTQSPKSYTRIIYYKGSRTWKLLKQIADRVGGEVTYTK